jgi:hypothetical protein
VSPHLGQVPPTDYPFGLQRKIREFVPPETKPEFWGYYADYDWVAFCQLFGRMIDLPAGYPTYCRDLKQIADERGVHLSDVVPQETEHHALSDARWNVAAWRYLNALPALLSNAEEVEGLRRRVELAEKALDQAGLRLIGDGRKVVAVLTRSGFGVQNAEDAPELVEYLRSRSSKDAAGGAQTEEFDRVVAKSADEGLINDPECVFHQRESNGVLGVEFEDIVGRKFRAQTWGREPWQFYDNHGQWVSLRKIDGSGPLDTKLMESLAAISEVY